MHFYYVILFGVYLSLQYNEIFAVMNFAKMAFAGFKISSINHYDSYKAA